MTTNKKIVNQGDILIEILEDYYNHLPLSWMEEDLLEDIKKDNYDNK